MTAIEQIRLFTSIKPPADDGELAYLRDCLASWRAAGFIAVAVNGPREIASLRKLDLPVEFAAAPADGKPRIGTILSAIRESGAPFAGIINADCRLIAYPGLDLASGLAGRLALGWRMDTTKGEELQAYRVGFDAFFFDTTVLPDDDCGLRIGEPWWDFWFPMACQRNGATVGTISIPLLIHQAHATNWSSKKWVENGRRVWSAMGKRGVPDLAEWAHDILADFHASRHDISLGVAPEIAAVLAAGGNALLTASSNAELAMIRNSLSWRITAPLRRARTLLSS